MMRQKIKEVLDGILKRFATLEIPPLTPVRVFPLSRDPDWQSPESGDRVMDLASEEDWDALCLKASFEQVHDQAQAAVLRLPLIERAIEWGIEAIRAVPANNTYLGCFVISEPKQILLASPEPIVYYHQLSHAAHQRLISHLVPWQTPRQEIVAGLCAQVVWQIMDGSEKFLGNTYRLIARHSFKLNVSALAGCHQFLPEIHHATRLVLTGDDTSHS
jgi:hypothetical protein